MSSPRCVFILVSKAVALTHNSFEARFIVFQLAPVQIPCAVCIYLSILWVIFEYVVFRVSQLSAKYKQPSYYSIFKIWTLSMI